MKFKEFRTETDPKPNDVQLHTNLQNAPKKDNFIKKIHKYGKSAMLIAGLGINALNSQAQTQEVKNDSNKLSKAKIENEISLLKNPSRIFHFKGSQYYTPADHSNNEADYNLEKNQNKYTQKLFELKKYIDSLDGELDYDKTTIQKRKNDLAAAIQYISDNNLTVDDLQKLANDSRRLFSAYVYTLQSKNPIGKADVLSSIKNVAEYSMMDINELHGQKNQFASVIHSSPEEIYFLCGYGQEEITTSTFLELYKLITTKLKNKGMSGYSMLENSGFDQGRTFIGQCASYNRLGDFLHTMSKEEQDKLLTWFVEGIVSEKEKVKEGSVVADAIASIDDPFILKKLGDIIQNNYQKTAQSNHEIETVYGLLGSMYQKKSHTKEKFFQTLSNEHPIETISKLPYNKLINSNGISVERYFFYDDTDGDASYRSFLNQYESDPQWHIATHEHYVEISSHKGAPIIIFANKPSNEEEGDNDINSILASKKLNINIAVLRGHSTHADDMIPRIPSTVGFVALGSCGGYHELSKILDRSPNTQVSSTMGKGTMKVNDPMLKKINEELRMGHDLDWESLWTYFKQNLGNNPDFKDYIPPHKNIRYRFVRAYNTIMNQKKADLSSIKN
ncbi:MAG: hypothetical protein WCO65_00365 [bacterium]